MPYFIDNLPESAKITISGLTGGDIVGYLSDDISLSGMVRYSSPETSAMQNKASAMLNGASGMANLVGGGDIPQTQAKNVQGTVVKWQGNDNFEFELPLLFVATKEGDDVRTSPKRLLGAMYPDMQANPSFTDMLIAPNSFTTTVGSSVATGGVCSIRIGAWFRAPKLFLVDNSSFHFSKETMDDTGFPMWARGVVHFTSYRILTREEVESFLP